MGMHMARLITPCLSSHGLRTFGVLSLVAVVVLFLTLHRLSWEVHEVELVSPGRVNQLPRFRAVVPAELPTPTYKGTHIISRQLKDSSSSQPVQSQDRDVPHSSGIDKVSRSLSKDEARRQLAVSSGLCFDGTAPISNISGFYQYNPEVGFFKVDTGTGIVQTPFVKDWFSNEKIVSSSDINVVLNTHKDATTCAVDGVFVPYCGPCASTADGNSLSINARDNTSSYQMKLSVATCVVFVTNSYIRDATSGLDGTCETFCASHDHSCFRGYRRMQRDSVVATDINTQDAETLTSCRAASIPSQLYSCQSSTGISCSTQIDCFVYTHDMESCVQSVCVCPQGWCWDATSQRCIFQHSSVAANAVVSTQLCEHDSLIPCNFECGAANMSCLPTTVPNAVSDLLELNYTCQCDTGTCYDDSTESCFSPPSPPSLIDPIVDCSFDFGTVSNDVDFGNAVCHCEAKQCIVPAVMTGYEGCEASPSFRAGYTNGTGVSYDDCVASIVCASNYRLSCQSTSITVNCTGRTGAEFEFDGCRPACAIPFDNEAYEFDCASTRIADDCLQYNSGANASLLSSGMCAVSCAAGYFNNSDITYSCSASSTQVQDFVLTGCEPGCTMPSDQSFYNLTFCPVLANVGGVDYYPQDAANCTISCASGGSSIATYSCSAPGGQYILSGCSGTCQYDAANIDITKFDGSCVTDSNGNVDIADISSSCAFACQSGLATIPGQLDVFCDGTNTISVVGCNVTTTCQIDLTSNLFDTYVFSGDCQTYSQTSSSSIDLLTCNISCATGFVTNTSGGNLGTCNASDGTGWVEIDATACLPQCMFPAWMAESAAPFTASGTSCVAARRSGFSTASDCPVACSSGYFDTACNSIQGSDLCTVDLISLPTWTNATNALLQCKALQNKMSDINNTNFVASFFNSSTAQCTVNISEIGFHTIANVFAKAEVLQTHLGSMPPAECAARCVTDSTCTAAFSATRSCADPLQCACGPSMSDSFDCYLTTTSQGYILRNINESSSSCLQSCFGLSCDDWIGLSGDYTANNPYSCSNLETTFSCDCSNCSCSGSGPFFRGATGTLYLKDRDRGVGGATTHCATTYDYFSFSGCVPLAYTFNTGQEVVNTDQTSSCIATLNKQLASTTGDLVSSCDVTCTDAQTGAGCFFSHSAILPTYVVEFSTQNGVWSLSASSPVCVVATCSDGILNADETDVDCGGSCTACVYVDESYCGVEFDVATETLLSNITVTGSGFQSISIDRITVVDSSGASPSPTATDFSFSVLSNTELVMEFRSFPFEYVGAIGIVVSYQDSLSATTTTQTLAATNISTIFVAAPILQQSFEVLNSTAAEVTLRGTGFDPNHCTSHTLVFSPLCGTVTAVATAACTSTSLTVSFTSLSSRSVGNLTAEVSIAGGPSSEPEIVAVVAAVAPVVTATAFLDGDPLFDTSVFLSVETDTVYYLNISGTGFDTSPTHNVILLRAFDANLIESAEFQPCNISSQPVLCPWVNWFDEVGSGVTRDLLYNVPMFLRTGFAGQLLEANVSTPGRCNGAPSLTSPSTGIAFIQSNPLIDSSNSLSEWTTTSYNITGSGFTTGFSSLLLPKSCDTPSGPTSVCNQSAFCDSTSRVDVTRVTTIVTDSWSSDSCYAYCYGNASCACFHFDSLTKTCNLFGTASCSLTSNFATSQRCNMVTTNLFDITGTYTYQSYTSAIVDIDTNSPELVGFQILIYLTGSTSSSATIYYETVANLTTFIDAVPVLTASSAVVESNAATLTLTGSGFGGIVANASVQFALQTPSTVLGQPRPLVTATVRTVTFTTIVVDFVSLNGRNIGSLFANVDIFGLQSSVVQVATIVVGNVSLVPYTVSGLVVNSTNVEFTVEGAGFDAGNMSLNSVSFLQIGSDVLDVASSSVSLLSVTRTSVTVGFITRSTQTDVDVVLQVQVLVPANESALNVAAVERTPASNGNGVIVARYVLEDPVLLRSTQLISVGTQRLLVEGSGFGVGSGVGATSLSVSFEGGLVEAVVLNHTTTTAWVEFTLLNCPSALGHLNASLAFTVNGTTKQSTYVTVAIVFEAVVQVASSSQRISYSDVGFLINASDSNPRDPTENHLYLRSDNSSQIEGTVISVDGTSLAVEFSYIEPFVGTLEAFVSSCGAVTTSISVSDYTPVAELVTGTWSAINASTNTILTSVEYLTIAGSGFSSNLNDTSVDLVSCGGPPSPSPNYPVQIQSFPILSTRQELRIGLDRLMPSNNGTELCVLLTLAPSRAQFVNPPHTISASVGMVKVAVPYFTPFNVSTLEFKTDEFVLQLDGRGFQATDAPSSRVESGLKLQVVTTGDITNETSNDTYSTVEVSTGGLGLFSPSDEGNLEARMELLFDGSIIDPSATFTHVANIIATPPTLCGVGTSCADASAVYLTSDIFDLAGRTFNAQLALNEVDFVASNLTSTTLTDAEAVTFAGSLVGQTGESLVPCICTASQNSIKVLWKVASAGCAGVSASTCSGGDAPSTSFTDIEIFAKVTCATSPCSSLTNCSNVTTNWTRVATMRNGAADLATNTDILFTDAENLTLTTLSSGNKFLVGDEYDQVVVFEPSSGNNVTATLIVETASRAIAVFSDLSPNNEGILKAQIVANLQGSSSSALTQVATLVAATPTVQQRNTSLVSNTYTLEIAGTGYDPVIPGNNIVVFTPEFGPAVIGAVESSTRYSLVVQITELSAENTGRLNATIQTVVNESLYQAQTGCIVDSVGVDPCRTSSSVEVATVITGGPIVTDTSTSQIYTTDDTLVYVYGSGFEIDFASTTVDLWVVNAAGSRDYLSPATVVDATVNVLTVSVAIARSQLGTVLAQVTVSANVQGVVQNLTSSSVNVGEIFLANWCPSQIASSSSVNVLPVGQLSAGAPNSSLLCDSATTIECVNTESATGFQCICNDSFTGTLCTEALQQCDANCRQTCTESLDCGLPFWTFNTGVNDGIFTNEVGPFYTYLLALGYSFSDLAQQPFLGSFLLCMQECSIQNSSFADPPHGGDYWYNIAYDYWMSTYYYGVDSSLVKSDASRIHPDVVLFLVLIIGGVLSK